MFIPSSLGRVFGGACLLSELHQEDMLGELYQTTGATPELFHKFIMNSSSEMSKASRRKQSKPNRLTANEEGAPQQTPLPALEQKDQASPSTSPVEKQVLQQNIKASNMSAIIIFHAYQNT